MTPSTTLNNAEYYPPNHVVKMLALANAISEVPDDDVRAVLRVCLAASVEPAGRLRRDGRALRYVPERVALDPTSTWRERVGKALVDLRGVRAEGAVELKVLVGDTRSAKTDALGHGYDWIVFSPPYPNNIDYTEVYKLENWILGYWDDEDDMRQARLRTLRSHPSIRFPGGYAYETAPYGSDVAALIQPILDEIPRDRYSFGRNQLVKGYADDMLGVLSKCRRVISPHGTLVYVVGNSHHGHSSSGYVIAADLILARLAELTGWSVEEIRIARFLGRRKQGDRLLRESVVVLKPNSGSGVNEPK
jgi:hypothetical protein